MAFSISIGDALLLAKIAWRVGETFTTGRHSAPVEFAEVQNLLFTLSKSLDLLAGCLPPQEGLHASVEKDGCVQPTSTAIKDADAILQHMVLNCSATLTHLEALVGKYTELEPSQRDDKPRLQRWRAEIWKNWKKVVWTKEGGNIMKLKGTLTAHISGLNVAVNSVSLALGRSTNEEVMSMSAEMNAKLDGLTELLSDLQRAKSSDMNHDAHVGGITRSLSIDVLTFAVHAEQPGSTRAILLCPLATFVADWHSSSSFATTPDRAGVFTCQCAGSESAKPPHQERLVFFVLPITLLVKRADPHGQRKYQMYAGSPFSTAPVSLIVSDVSPRGVREFEHEVDSLATTQASNTVQSRQDSMLISHNSRAEAGGVVAILNMTIGYARVANDILAVSISSGGRSFGLPPVKSLQVVHYRFTPDVGLADGGARGAKERVIVHQSYADMIITCKSSEFATADEPSGQKYSIHVFRDTTVDFGEHARSVVIQDVTCEAQDGQSDESRSTWLQSCAVCIEFRSAQSAGQFRDAVEGIKRELLILYLQRPSFGDQVVYVQGIGDALIFDYLFTGATLTVVCDTQAEEYRLILLSGCHNVSACLKLPARYVQGIAQNSASIDDPWPATFVRGEADQMLIRKQPISIRRLLGHQKVDSRTVPFLGGN